MKNIIKNQILESILVKNEFVQQDVYIHKVGLIIKEISRQLAKGKKILIAGNGGSASDAQHFAAEIVGRFKLERRGYPAIALNTDCSVMTAWSNDYSFDTVYARQVEALGDKGDIFIGISTSGNSKNIIEAINKAKETGMISICLLGKDGGRLKELCDMSLIVPSENTARVQEVHILIIHIICSEVEKGFK